MTNDYIRNVDAKTIIDRLRNCVNSHCTECHYIDDGYCTEHLIKDTLEFLENTTREDNPTQYCSQCEYLKKYGYGYYECMNEKHRGRRIDRYDHFCEDGKRKE